MTCVGGKICLQDYTNKSILKTGTSFLNAEVLILLIITNTTSEVYTKDRCVTPFVEREVTYPITVQK
jgi:hypothetical protein